MVFLTEQNNFLYEYFKIIYIIYKYLYNYLVFIPANEYINYFNATNQIDSWKSNGISQESIENMTKLDGSFATVFVDPHLLPDMI